MRRRELVVGIAALASVSLAGCSSDGGDESDTTETSDGTDSEMTETGTGASQQMGDPDGEVIGNDGPLVITEYSSEVRYYESELDSVESGDRYVIDGVLENTSDEMKSARIEAEFFDADGNSLNAVPFQELGIEAGGTWEFDTFYNGDPEEVDSYTLEPSEL